MPHKPSEKKRPKLTDAERHERFVDMAREVEASEAANDFDEAFRRVTPSPKASTQDGS